MTRPALDYIARPQAGSTTRVVLHLALHNRAALEQLVFAQSRPGTASYRKFLTPADFKRRFGVSAADVARVAHEVQPFGMRVVAAGTQDVTIEGPRAAVEHAFKTELWFARNGAAGVALAAKRPFVLPAALQDAVVTNFSQAIIKHVHSTRVRASFLRNASRPHSELSPVGGYLTSDLKQAYRYPSYETLRGRGATIGILVDGDFLDADMRRYFGVQNLPVPTLLRRPVDGGSPNSDPDSEETELDIQQSGGMAPGARIVHYNVPNLSDTSIYDGLKAIVDDNIVDIVNQSFGGCEAYYNGQYTLLFGPQSVPATLFAENDLILQGTLQGQTFVASSGDNGDSPCFSPAVAYGDKTRIKGVEFPASSPWEAAVGGTNLVTTYHPGSTRSEYVRENAFGDSANSDLSFFDWGSGGGESRFFPEPFYQSTFHIPTAGGRAIPDLAGHMGGCPGFAIQPCGPDRSSDLLFYQGNFVGVIGTSASAPDFAGLAALTIEANGGGRLGLIDAAVYSLAATNGNPVTYFNADVLGSNGLPTRPGYDEVTGVGSINGLAFTGQFAGAVAGDPGTPSNPGPAPQGASFDKPQISAQRDSLVLLGHRDVDPTAAQAIGIDEPLPPPLSNGFDGTDGRCAINALYTYKPVPLCDLSNFGLAVGDQTVFEAFPSQVALFDRRGTLQPGWPKALDDVFGPTYAFQEQPACTYHGGCRNYSNVHAAYDPATHRYWVTAVEFDVDANSTKPARSSQWIAVSAGPRATGVWHVYQYAYPDVRQVLRGAGFGFDAAAIYVTGDEAPNTYSAPAFSYLVALDKHRLEAGIPSRAIGFSHLADRNSAVVSLAPVHPATVTDETTGPEFVVSNYSQSPAPRNCPVVSACSQALIWAMAQPLSTPLLSAEPARTDPYRDAPSASGGVLAMPTVARGHVSFAFASGEFGPSHIIDGASWAEVVPHVSGGVLRSIDTAASGSIVSTTDGNLEFASVTPDDRGRLFFTDVSFEKNGVVTETRERSVAGVMSAPSPVVVGVPKPSSFSGYPAASFVDNAFWFVLPYVFPPQPIAVCAVRICIGQSSIIGHRQ